MHSAAPNRFDTIVIGGGQSGLAAGYHLNRAGGSFLIVDANQRSGDGWRGRWDSLAVFPRAIRLVARTATYDAKGYLPT